MPSWLDGLPDRLFNDQDGYQVSVRRKCSADKLADAFLNSQAATTPFPSPTTSPDDRRRCSWVSFGTTRKEHR